MEAEATKATNNPYMTVAAAVVETTAAPAAVTTSTSTTPAAMAGPVSGGGDNPGTTEKLLAWLGCLIVNAAFISFILFWIATDRWWIGFVVSILYTALLFVLAHAWYEDDDDPKNKWRRCCFWFCSSPTTGLAAEVEGESMAGPSPPPPRRRPRMLVTLLYGLAVLSLGGTGLLLALNVIRCDSITTNNYNDDDGSWSTTPPQPPPFVWTTNVTSLPAGVVQSWAAIPATTTVPPRGATFLHLPGLDNGITLFDEESPDGDMFVSNNDNPIWSVAPNVNNGQPVQLHDYPGHEFVLISNNNNETTTSTGCCFATTTTAGSTDPDSPFAAWVRRVPTVACSDGRTVRFVDIETYSSGGAPIVVHVDPRDLIVDNGLVWYKDNPPPPYEHLSDTLIYSLDPIQMVETLHSPQRLNNNNNNIEVVVVVDNNNDVDDENNDDDDDASCRRKVATTALFLAALPVTFLSIYLWYRRHIPSMGLTVFAGMIGTAWCIFFIAVESNDWLGDHAGDFSNWLLFSLGAMWMIFTTNGILSLSSSSSSSRASSSLSSSPQQLHMVAPMRWGLNIGALAFDAGSFNLLDLFADFFKGLFDHEHTVPEWVRWMLFNVAVLAPTCLLGLATQSSLLLVLTAAGVVFDALRLSQAITRSWDDDGSLGALVYFVVLGCTGLAIAVLGWWTSRRQGQLAERFSSYLAPYTWWPAPRPATTTDGAGRRQRDVGTKSTTTKAAVTLLSAADNAPPTPSREVPPPEAAPPTTTSTAVAAANEETTA